MKKIILIAAVIPLSFLAKSQNLIQSATLDLAPVSTPEKPKAYTAPKALNALWGANASVGVADGQFSNPFVQSNVGPYDPNAWTARSLEESDGLSMPGNAYWVRTLIGISQGGYSVGTIPIASPSAANGAAMFDSDYLDNAGIAGNFGFGSSPGAHSGDLISPRIDLTGYTDTALTVRFFCKWRNFNASHSVAISVDDGNTWSEVSTSLILAAPSGQTSEGWVNALFANATAGVSNLTSCRIKFNFSGYYYFAIVDDVSVCAAPKHDLSIGKPNPSGNDAQSQYEEYQVTNNKHFPVSQMAVSNYIFGGNVRNDGYEPVTPQDSATLSITIEQDNSGTWTQVHTDTIDIPLFYTNSGLPVLDTMTNFSWLQVGNFRAKYHVHSVKDWNPDNDSLYNYFTITPNDYASKVPRSASGSPLVNTRAIPAGNFDAFEFGSMFQFPTAGTEALIADSISYSYFVSNGYIGNSTVYARVRIQEWNDGTGSGTLDGTADDVSEFTVVAEAIDTLSSFVNGATYYSKVQVADINTLMPSYTMEDNKIYYVSVSFENTLNNLTVLNNNNMFWLGSNNSENYSMNFGLTSATSPLISPCHLNLTSGGVTDSYSLGFSASTIPAIGLHISQGCVNSIADFDTTTNYLQVSFTDATTATSTSGSAVSWSWDFGDGTTSTLQNPTHTYADSGTYIVCLTITDNCGPSTVCDTISVLKNFANVADNWMNNVQMYPVPASDFVTIDGIQFEGTFSIEIVDLTGKIIRTMNYQGASQVTVDLKNEACGSYILRLSNSTSNISKSLLILK